MSEALTMIDSNMGMTDDDLNGKYLTFYIDNVVYGVELTNVIEIISVQKATTVPGTPPYVKGIINLRGSIVPVLDVRLKFNLPEREYDERTCIIVIMIHDMQVAMIVDSVAEVANIENNDAATLPEFTNVNTKKYLHSIASVDGHLVLNLDCEKFLQDDAFGGF